MQQKLNRTALAKALKLDPKTVRKYLAMPQAPHPDGNGCYSVDEAQEFIAREGSRASDAVSYNDRDYQLVMSGAVFVECGMTKAVHQLLPQLVGKSAAQMKTLLDNALETRGALVIQGLAGWMKRGEHLDILWEKTPASASAPVDADATGDE